MDAIDSQLPTPTPKKKFSKKLVAAGVLVAVLIISAAFLLLPKGPGKAPQKETKVEEEVKDANVLPSKETRSYKILINVSGTLDSFIHWGNPSTVFSPLSAYYLGSDNKLISFPLAPRISSKEGESWCYGDGKDPFNFSYDLSTAYCFENINNKKVLIRRIDLRTAEFKEYLFESGSNLFTTSRTSKVLSSRDGDSALIYSTAGAYVFESQTRNLYKVDLPTNLEIVNAVSLSNVESALVTSGNQIYRVNFSSHKGGIFDVNFIGINQSDLSKGLKSLRLSKDSRRLIFTISDKIVRPSSDRTVPFQSSVVYNIDLGTAKVSDELNPEEKFLVSCANLVGNRYCLLTEEQRISAREINELLLKGEYNSGLVEVLKAPVLEGYPRISFQASFPSSNLVYIKTPVRIDIGERQALVFPLVYSYNAQTGAISALRY